MAVSTGRDAGTAQARKRANPSTNSTVPLVPKLEATTDKTRWRMKDTKGCHTWHYLEDDEAAKAWPQSYADKWYLQLPMVQPQQRPLRLRSSRG